MIYLHKQYIPPAPRPGLIGTDQSFGYRLIDKILGDYLEISSVFPHWARILLFPYRQFGYDLPLVSLGE
jgi:hypothetical protein